MVDLITILIFRFFVALNAAGQLIAVCPYTLLMRRLQWRNLNTVVDFKLVGTSATEAVIIAITSSNNQEPNHLCMLSYPGNNFAFCPALIIRTWFV